MCIQNICDVNMKTDEVTSAFSNLLGLAEVLLSVQQRIDRGCNED